MFARLQRCSGLLDAAKVYRSIYILLNSKSSHASFITEKRDVLPPDGSNIYTEMSEIDNNFLKESEASSHDVLLPDDSESLDSPGML